MSEVEATRRKAKREGKDVTVDWIMVDDEEKPQEVVRILDNDPIRKLFNRDTITDAQFLAAEMLYSDWHIGNINPSVVKPFKSIDYDKGHKADYDDTQRMIDAKKRYYAAFDYIQSKKIKDVIEAIIINTLDVKIVSGYCFPGKSTIQSQGKVVDRLQIGLDLLDEFYKEKKNG